MGRPSVPELSPQQLATVVVKQSTGVSVKIGQCNGKAVLHLIRWANPAAGRKHSESRTIGATVVDWNLDPWNEASPYNPRNKKEQEA